MLEALTAINAIEIVQSDTTIYDPPLKALIITAPGVVEIENGKGDMVTFTIPAAVENLTTTALPFILPGRVRRVMAATTVADANLTGLR